jgi:hypothetical protein
VEGRDPKEKEKAMTAGELLWENRENIPFLLLDDPSYTVPQVTRIVGLPDGRAIWRVPHSVFCTSPTCTPRRGSATRLRGFASSAI